MKNSCLVAGITLVAGVTGHSWADDVAGGSFRGGQGGSDLVKERYYCPLPTLEACQPPAKNGIMLTPDAMNACRTDYPTPSWGNAVAGQPMYVHWAGNGHTGSKGDGTCVTIKIAPYALDPPKSSFTTLAECLPYSHDGDITDASVNLPSNLPAGDYTVFWEWDFPPFWFSSCSDIRVTSTSASSNTPTTYSPQTTMTMAASVGTPSMQATRTPPSEVVQVTTIAPSTARPLTVEVTTRAPSTTESTKQMPATSPLTVGSALPVSTDDCKRYLKPNEQCALQYGPASYCPSWVMDKCGHSHCFGTTYDDSHC